MGAVEMADLFLEAAAEVVMQGPWPKLGPGEIADIMAYLQTPLQDR